MSTINGASFAGTINGSAHLNGSINTGGALNGSMNGAAQLVGNMTGNAAIVGTIQAGETLTGTISMTRVLDELDPYEGAYSVSPAVTAQELETKNLRMTGNVSIAAIPYYEVANKANGETVIIGA